MIAIGQVREKRDDELVPGVTIQVIGGLILNNDQRQEQLTSI